MPAVSENDWLRRHLTVSKNEPLALRLSEIECLVKSFSRQMTVSENDQLRHHLTVSKKEPLGVTWAFRMRKTGHFEFRGAKQDTSNFAARNRTRRVSRRETGHFAFRGAKPDTPG
jgi:hypothetical protein